MPTPLCDHFERYRAALQEDALTDFEHFAKNTPTKHPDKYPTIYDYIKTLYQAVSGAALNYQQADYQRFLNSHQYAMIQLFNAMVETLIWGYDGVDENTILSLIEEYGWGWFRFNKKSLKIKLKSRDEPIHVVPRYTSDNWDFPLTLDADEMFLIEKEEADVYKVLDHKAHAERPSKLFTIGRTFMSFEPIKTFNTPDIIRDWTLPLRIPS